VDDFAFPSRVDATGHLSTRQYARLVDEWVSAIGCAERNTARTRFDAPKHRSSIKRLAIFVRFKSYLGTPRSKTP
jgi:hypothetical protein